MQKKTKGIIIFTAVLMLISATFFTGYAQTINKAITVSYNNIKIYIDGALFQPKDSTGNIVEPFIYKGTTYLPIRAVSEAIGKEVSWDGGTNSIYLGKAPIKEVTVSTAQEFVQALGSNKTIMLKPGVYDLSSTKQINNQDNSITWKPVYDGKELNLNNISNLTIQGSKEGKTEIRTSPRFAHIIYFSNCNNITIKNIIAGHTPQEYECDAGVLGFYACDNILISSSELYGSGSVGVNLDNTTYFNFENSTITQCSLRAVDCDSSEHILFLDSKITGIDKAQDLINIRRSNNINFENCNISNNKFYWGFIDASDAASVTFSKCNFTNNKILCEYETFAEKITTYFISTDHFVGNGDSMVTIEDSILKDNECDFFGEKKAQVVMKNTPIEGNTFNEGEYEN